MKRETITYVDAQGMRIKNPDTFSAPSKEELDDLYIGDFVKICANNKERFWVIITSINGQNISGIVDNELISTDLKRGEIISFTMNNIYDIIRRN